MFWCPILLGRKNWPKLIIFQGFCGFSGCWALDMPLFCKRKCWKPTVNALSKPGAENLQNCLGTASRFLKWMDNVFLQLFIWELLSKFQKNLFFLTQSPHPTVKNKERKGMCFSLFSLFKRKSIEIDLMESLETFW